jgi:hypothetical protein
MATKKDIIATLQRMSDLHGEGVSGCFYGDTLYDSRSVAHGYKEAINEAILMLNKTHIDQYPDTEADGYVFCGKCGKMT